MTRTPNLERLRGFALVMGVILLTWTLAGISLDESAVITPLGIPFRISRPDLLPIGIALAALYGLTRYYYYAHMLGPSPYRVRREILSGLFVDEEVLGKTKHVPIYFGPSKFSPKVWHGERETVERQAEEARNVFPKFAGARVKAEVRWQPGWDDEGKEYTSFGLHLTVPIRCRLAAFLQDADYSSPVWFNALVLATWALQTLR